MERETVKQLFGNNFIGKDELKPFFKVVLSLFTTMFAMKIFVVMTMFVAATLTTIAIVYMWISTMMLMK